MLIELLIGLDNTGMHELRTFYAYKFSNPIERDIGGMERVTTSAKRLAQSLLQGVRNETGVIDYEEVEQDARELSDAGPNRFGTEKPVFNELLTLRSYEHMKVVFARYRVEAYEDIGESIRSQLMAETQEIYQMVVDMILTPRAYFAKALLKNMKGIGTDDEELSKIVVWRSEIDLEEIKEEFNEIAGKSLGEYIGLDTSGHFRSLLLAIVK